MKCSLAFRVFVLVLVLEKDPNDSKGGSKWAIAVPLLHDDDDHHGRVYVDDFLCVGNAEWWTTSNPSYVDTWECEFYRRPVRFCHSGRCTRTRTP